MIEWGELRALSGATLDEAVSALSSVSFTLGSVTLNLYGVLKSLLAFGLLIWFVGWLVHKLERRLRRVRGLHVSNRALILKFFQIFLYFVVFVAAMQMMGINLTALSVFGGALGVGLGFGLQKIASNFVSGIILLFEKSVELGDLIELHDGTSGFVRHTGARYTLLEMQDGREIMIPNEEFISQRVVSWTHSNAQGRVEVIIHLDVNTDIVRARQLMLEAAKAHPKTLRDPAPVCFVNRFIEGTVEMQLFFWIGDMVDGRLEPKSDVLTKIWQLFREEKIIVSFPQRGFLMREGTLA
jgi:small-conductance mechanosensitive channel